MPIGGCKVSASLVPGSFPLLNGFRVRFFLVSVQIVGPENQWSCGTGEWFVYCRMGRGTSRGTDRFLTPPVSHETEGLLL